MIKKVKIASVFINEEKQIKGKKDGKIYNLCEVNCKLASDSLEYPDKYVKVTIFAYNDLKDSSKNKTATEKANYFKSENDGKEILLDIIENNYINKDGINAISLTGKILTKSQKQVASQFLK